MTYIYSDIHTRYGDWKLHLYVNSDGLDADTILDKLDLIGCSGETILNAELALRDGRVDTGLTYSNFSRRTTVMVIAKTSSIAEFSNSYHHELQHLLQHQMQVFNISPWGEEAAYLAGDTACSLYPKIRRFL